ncbi:hypothetical protein NKH18_46335 [Streptomyces sp. M10(2022)]
MDATEVLLAGAVINMLAVGVLSAALLAAAAGLWARTVEDGALAKHAGTRSAR